MSTESNPERSPLRVDHFFEEGDEIAGEASLTLPFATRQKSRFRAQLDDGREVGVALPRGGVLRDDDQLRSDCGLRIRVRAAQEELAIVDATDPLDLARACYHLGNRHVPLQIDASGLRFLPDHVLEDMLRDRNLRVRRGSASFDPEGGAYAHVHGHASADSHSHSHSHEDAHDHDH